MRLCFISILLTTFVLAGPAAAQDYFRGKTITLFAGQPPGGSIDSETRLVAHYLGKSIPGGPAVVARL